MPKKFKKARSASAVSINGAAGVRTLEVTAKADHEAASAQPVHTDPAESRKTVRAIAAGLAVLVALVFFRVAAFQFVSFDDPYSVYNNPHVTHGLTAESIRWAFTDTATF